MHPLVENGMGVPAFLAKLWRLVEDSETNNLITWGLDGRSFIIQNQAKFAKELLPLNYKHNNMASFIRQLNMYGFHKITSIDNGGLKFDKDEMEFSHPYFQKGHPYLLEHIKRKIANTKAVEVEKPGTKAETVSRVLTEVKNMRGRQESLDTRFSAMKQENEALWREVAILRQKHIKQQQIVNKLIQFLVTIVQPQRSGLNTGIGKRRGQLMINDAPQSKMRKSNQGPVIRELTEDLLDDLDSDLDDIPNIDQSNVQSPESQSSKDYDGSSGSIDLGLDNIDEIDTNSMAIYSDKSVNKDRRNAKRSQQLSEPEVVETSSVNVNNVKKSQQPSKSLLIPSNKDEASNVIDADLMLNVFDDQGLMNNNVAGTSGLLDNNVEVQNTLFDDASQPPSDLQDNDLFGMDDKKSALAEVTKYNPKHAHDILRLNSVDEFSSHLNNVQNDLDSLKDLLGGDASGYQLDANQLLGEQQQLVPTYMPQSSFDADTLNKLFGTDEIEGYEMSPSNMDLFDDVKKDDNAGAENRTYQSSPYNNTLDLNELLQGDLCGEQIEALQN